MSWIKTHCGRMDHGGCSILVKKEGNKIIDIKPDPKGYLNRGYICTKGIYSYKKLTHPERLTYPLKRKGGRGEGKWERISWDQALEEISEAFLSIRREYGPEAIAFGAGMPKGLDHFVLIRLANTFGSPNVVMPQDVCHAPREISGIHTCGFYPVADLQSQSSLILLWGSNPPSTNEEGQICSLLLKQLREGTKLIVVDPRRIPLCDKATMHLQIRPGTDAALALSMIHVIIEEGLYDREFVTDWTYGFEELSEHVRSFSPEKVSDIAWIDPSLIREAARIYATSKPAAIQWGNPIEHNINSFHASRALICLMAICGNLAVPGGNIWAKDPPLLSLREFVRADTLPEKWKKMVNKAYGVIPRFMTVPSSFFKKAVLEGYPYPIKGYFCMASNPVLCWPDSNETIRALKALEFFVISEIFLTPTAMLADIVLPAATQFEFNDIGHYGLGHGIVFARPKVVDPPLECWPDMKILNELGKRLTSPEYWYEDYRGLLDEVLKPSGLTYKEFIEVGYLKGEESSRFYKSQGFKTPTKKVELSLSTSKRFNIPSFPEFLELPALSDEFPYVLTSSKNRYYLHSSYRWVEELRKRSPVPTVELHPETAKAYGISDGEEIIIETEFGSIVQVAKITERIHPKVICASYGWYFPESSPEKMYDYTRSNYNMLTKAFPLGKEFATPNLKGIPCRIKKN